MNPLLGQFAALIASIAFSITSTSFTLAGRKYAPRLVMGFSLPIGMLCMMLLHLILNGSFFPAHVEFSHWFWLGLSGIMGFWLASIALVNAFMIIGPRLTLLITSISPIMSAILAWVFLDEKLDVLSVLGIAVTIFGVAWVVSGGMGTGVFSETTQTYRQGVIFAIIASLIQGFSFVFSKQGLSDNFDPISGSLIRIIVATLGIWLYILWNGQMKSSMNVLQERSIAFRLLVVGAIMGPVIGASLVLVALQNAPVGIATTLSNLTPIFLIPISYFVFKEKVTHGAMFGTAIAFVGTAILFL